MAMCKDVVENIIGYIEAELDHKTLEELVKHSADCPECQAFIRTYSRMLELAGQLKKKSFVTPEIRRRLKEFLRSRISPC
jgi:hypothetical protein